MNLVLFSHPPFLDSQSMRRFAQSLADSFAARGHRVEIRTARARMQAWFAGSRLAKWAGYVDQYVLFPVEARRRLRLDPPDTLYVFCDQALGPWVPLVSDRPHVVHCHDLLALRSALGLIDENRTGFSGRLYQHYIRRGFAKARHFISVSQRSRRDLHEFGQVDPALSEVVYNGLNHPYFPEDPAEAEARLRAAGLPKCPRGMLLHVGGSQWYKNTAGIIRLYAAYVAKTESPLPLWMVSPAPAQEIRDEIARVPAAGQVLFFQGIDNDVLRAAYSRARAFLFPSLAEGFGWPIAEALACGCMVITTDEAPMNEVGGEAAFYLPRCPGSAAGAQAWAEEGAGLLADVLNLSDAQRAERAGLGIRWSRTFDADAAIDDYLSVYENVASRYGRAGAAPGRH